MGARAQAFVCTCVWRRGLQKANAAAGQVMYGLYYVEGERKEQHNRVREVILEHLRRYPAALLVVEEYDKLDCPSRAVLRQLLENPREANLSSARCGAALAPRNLARSIVRPAPLASTGVFVYALANLASSWPALCVHLPLTR